MNAAQRAILKVVLAIEGLLILRPPVHVGRRAYDLEYHWLPFLIFGRGPVSIDFGSLAEAIFVVSLVGFTAAVLAKGIPDERTRVVLRGLSKPARSTWAFIARHPILSANICMSLLLIAAWVIARMSPP